MSGPLVLVGDSLFAQIAYEYFTHDSPYDVVAFAVEREYRRRDELFGLPVVDFESIAERFPPDEHSAYVALVYTQLNRLRTRLADAADRVAVEKRHEHADRAVVQRDGRRQVRPRLRPRPFSARHVDAAELLPPHRYGSTPKSSYELCSRRSLRAGR